MLLYAVAKFLAYSAWCFVGLRLARAEAATVGASLRLGAVRWCIGLAFGFLVFLIVGSIDPSAVARTYFVVYSPLRAVEWGVMAFLIWDRGESPSIGSAVLWCTGGMLVSFLTDLVSPEGLEGRFCVGRCLC